MVLIAGCGDVIVMIYVVSRRVFAFVSTYFLIFVVCLFGNMSVNTTSFCVWFCVSICVDVSYYRRFALYHNEYGLDVKIIFLFFYRVATGNDHFHFHRDYERICVNMFYNTTKIKSFFHT